MRRSWIEELRRSDIVIVGLIKCCQECVVGRAQQCRKAVVQQKVAVGSACFPALDGQLVIHIEIPRPRSPSRLPTSSPGATSLQTESKLFYQTIAFKRGSRPDKLRRWKACITTALRLQPNVRVSENAWSAVVGLCRSTKHAENIQSTQFANAL